MNDPRALPGEPLALDLADTEFVPDGTVVDLLATAESARAWAAAAGLAGTLDEAGHNALRQARSAIRDALEGRGAAPLNAVLDKGRVRLSVSDALTPARTLQADEPAWQPAVLAAANLLDLLETAPDRVKHCENPDCVLWFFDTTRNGTRRWCSMAVCGNRMKARRHYDRVKARLPAQNRIIRVRRCKQHTRAFSRPDSAIRSSAGQRPDHAQRLPAVGVQAEGGCCTGMSSRAPGGQGADRAAGEARSRPL